MRGRGRGGSSSVEHEHSRYTGRRGRGTLAGMVLLLSLACQTDAVERVLPVPDYHWHGGCTPTSVGMIMGWYDRQGYGGVDYSNLIPGGVAEFTNRISTIEGYDGDPSARSSKAICSTGHTADFWNTDNYRGRPFDCIADFLLTSLDKPGKSSQDTNGATTWGNWISGIDAYVKYCGYRGASVADRHLDTDGGDFTYEDFKAEINASRPVMLYVEGDYAHSMVGYGYDDSGGVPRIFLHDTWEPGRHAMRWGGTYEQEGFLGIFPGESARLTYVTTIELQGVPEPGTLGLLMFCGAGLLRRRRKVHRSAIVEPKDGVGRRMGAGLGARSDC